MIVLILGGLGNLGTQLSKAFSSDYTVVAWDRDDLDVSDYDLLAYNIRQLRPQLIVNAVAFNNVDACENPEQYPVARDLNGDMPGVLADLALENDAVLIHYSSDYVFSGTELKPFFNEEDVPNPVNKYGETKAQGEWEVTKRATRGLRYYLIRTSKLFGPAGSSPLAKSSFFDIISLAAKSNSELSVVNEELSCFTYTPDLAQASVRLVKTKAVSGIYHLVNESPATWYDGAQELFRLNKQKIKIRPIRSEDLARVARRPKFSVLKNNQSRKLRGWHEALREYLRDQSKLGGEDQIVTPGS